MPYNTSRRAFTLIELLVVIAIINLLMAITLPSLDVMRENVRRNQCRSNLSKLVLAVKAHEEAMGVLPSGTTNDAGPVRNIPVGQHIGWIARTLPFLEQTPLYDEINFEKSVYDTENRAVWLFQAPEVLVCPSNVQLKTPFSHYMACHDGVETAIDTANRGVFFLNSKLRSRDIADGNSYTIWLGEGQIPASSSLGWMSGTPGTLRNTAGKINSVQKHAVDWPMPFDGGGCFDATLLPYQGTEMPGQLFVGSFGSLHPYGANFALGDGNVRMLYVELDAKIYEQLGRRDDAGPLLLDE